MPLSQRAGRYAPSPTGSLHLGSLLAAVGSYLQARAQGAAWYLRIDDLDAPRVVTGMAEEHQQTLEAFGLRWDGSVVYQSQRGSAYERTLAALLAAGQAFECGCTRREAQTGPQGIEGPIYPGTCRAGLPAGRAARSIRLRVPDVVIALDDAVQGHYGQRLATDIGDFVIRRADGITAYQLATVVDDAYQGVAEVVRGADLLSSTPRQIWLQRVLGLATPRYAHLPLLVDDRGHKLSKSEGAAALSARALDAQLWRCLSLLGQHPPDALKDRGITGLLRWATDNWDIACVPRVASVAWPGEATNAPCPSVRDWPSSGR